MAVAFVVIFADRQIHGDFLPGTVYEGFVYSDGGDGTCVIMAYEGNESDITIPSMIEGKNVIGVMNLIWDAVPPTGTLRSVTVPEGVTFLNGNTFAGSVDLQKVYLPKTLEVISSNVFLQYDGTAAVKEIIYAGTENMWRDVARDVYIHKDTKVICSDTVVAPVVVVTTNPSDNVFTYDGKKHYMELIVKHTDGTPVGSENYSITYDSDCTSIGMQYVTITFFGDYAIKNYSGTYTYSILPGKTEKVDVEIVGNDAKISWKAVPGATHYRLCMFDESVGYYKELLWDDGSFEAPYLTKTVSGLEKGKTYKMSVKAVWWSDDGQRAAPSEQEKEFEVRIPLPGEKVSSGESIENEVTSATDEITEEASDDETTKDDVATDSQATEKTEENTTKEEKETGEMDKMGGDGKKGNLFSRYLVGAVVVIAEVAVLAGVSLYIVIKKKK